EPERQRELHPVGSGRNRRADPLAQCPCTQRRAADLHGQPDPVRRVTDKLGNPPMRFIVLSVELSRRPSRINPMNSRALVGTYFVDTLPFIETIVVGPSEQESGPYSVQVASRQRVHLHHWLDLHPILDRTEAPQP